MRRFSTLVLGMICCGPALAGDWFDHEFGEQRRYLKDWLAVCDNGGAGPCRVVQLPVEGSDRRLALHAVAGGWEISIFDRDMPAADVSWLGFDIDGRVELYFSGFGFRQGEREIKNIADTLTVDGSLQLKGLIPMLQSGSGVIVRYAPEGSGDGFANFSLRGLTAAMLAVDEKLGRLPN